LADRSIYLTFGGIYRDVELRFVADRFIGNVFAKPVNVLQNDRRLNVRVFIDGKRDTSMKLTAELRDGSRVVATASQNVSGSESQDVVLTKSRPNRALGTRQTQAL
jgi:beta-galactosidase